MGRKIYFLIDQRKSAIFRLILLNMHCKIKLHNSCLWKLHRNLRYIEVTVDCYERSVEALLASMLMEIKFIISDMTINTSCLLNMHFFLLRVRIIRNSFLLMLPFCFSFLYAVKVNGKDVWAFPHLSSRITADFFILHLPLTCTGSDGYYNCGKKIKPVVSG